MSLQEKKMSTKPQQTKKVEIDFMYIDLEVCTRCKGTDRNLETALETVRSVLESGGVEVGVRKILVDSEHRATELAFVSSPTIRVDGQDIALELRETSCASCGEACGCEGGVSCRVWVYQGKEYTIAPVPMIVDAILSAVYSSKEDMPTAASAVSVPENLKRFFTAKAAKAESPCCTVNEQATCCEPAEKSPCCAPETVRDQLAGCGCR